MRNRSPSDTSVYHIFERLNTGGTLLANQEIRNCVYRGTFNELLHELNSLPVWRRIVGRSLADSRQRDVELILRFFALLDLSHYEKPMKEFLSKFMRINRERSDTTLDQLRELFTQTCSIIAEHLGDRPFHIRTGLNSAVFDCVTVACANHLSEIPEDLSARYARLTNDSMFLRNVSAGTTDEEVVKYRFSAAKDVLFA